MAQPASVPPPPPPPVQPGEVVAGKYVVDREIAAGGMGLVFSAKHVELDQAVALKFMRAELRGHISTSRFTLEARATAKLRSAHVARVFDVGVIEDGTPFMVMELLEGIDLERLVEERGCLSPEVAAELVTQACEAVAEAHDAGIIHRDLKPANLFLTKTPQGAPFVKVLDFGISKATVEAPTRATAAGTIMGSPPYMSPETLKSSRNADVRSDIWALGVILYELATGRLPFDGEGVGDIALKVHNDEPVWPAVLDPNIPKEYDEIVRSCLEKDPSKRYGSVIELRDALVGFAASRATDGMTLSIRTTSPRIVVVDEPAPVAPTTPRTVQAQQEQAATTVIPPRQQGELPRPRPSRGVLAGALAIGAALTAAIAFVAMSRTTVPHASASRPEAPAATALATSEPAATAVREAAPAALPETGVTGTRATEATPPSATTSSPKRGAAPHPRTRAKAAEAAPAVAAPEAPALASSTSAPPAVQPPAAPSTGRALRDRGF